MGKPAARLTDMTTCPMVTGVVPHVGGPIVGPGAATVLIGAMPASIVGDSITCVGPPSTVAMGAATVLVTGKPAARLGDQTAHGGSIILGCPTVLVGNNEQLRALRDASADGAPYCDIVPAAKPSS